MYFNTTRLLQGNGKLYEQKDVQIIHKTVSAGDGIPPHSHPDCWVLFIPVQGNFSVEINEDSYEVIPGQILEFDGNATMSAHCEQHSQAMVVLQRKQEFSL